jgi:GTPase
LSGSAPLATRAGFVALIGAPNAGKSTLLNALVGQKVSIVTHKVQTTRALVRGIVIHKNAQIVFVDTPGIFAPRRRLERAMVTTAWGGAADADVVALLVDAKRGLTDEDRTILEKLGEFPVGRELVLVLNKVDIVKRDTLLALAKGANELARFSRTFMVSALKGDGVPDLLDHFAAAMPESPFLYPEDQMTDLPLRFSCGGDHA